MTPDAVDRIRALVRDVPNFPEPGVMFRDLTGVFASAQGLRDTADAIIATAPEGIELIAGLDARGFIVGATVAARLGIGFVPVRKAGKLPPPTTAISFDLEYGRATFELRDTTVNAGQRVLVVDDLLATGGSARAAGALLRRSGAHLLGYSFLVELIGLAGRESLEADPEAGGVPVHSVLTLPA
ncbi:adenine phosphoribosyltransferase [Rarobacter faecitabidus]|uniref:Adenine phosphoribosyltransferase n=1 Tax=Rarobacter faecitabidus TaxID=13243 RepID=A0A542ZV33_RARFA|nr:adenine phosphoribosyltransferase [Rarobacter faecitabidus]TQL64223.1 adenine phosphoribosyltransferase [Rarobacter faecitabidus]